VIFMTNSSTCQIVKEFVKGPLGCQCPDEVFKDIEMLMEDDGLRILIGKRLIVRLFPLGKKSATITVEKLLQIFESGQRERELKGYNRFRLVLVVNDNDDAKPRIDDLSQKVMIVFKKARNYDDRMHLHVIDEGTVPEVLRVMAGMKVY
jgi:hypothetical protein